MTTKAEIAHAITSKINLHPNGVTSGELYELYGFAFGDIPGGVPRASAIDYIQKSLSKKIAGRQITFKEKVGNHGRIYYPINGDCNASIPIDGERKSRTENPESVPESDTDLFSEADHWIAEPGEASDPAEACAAGKQQPVKEQSPVNGMTFQEDVFHWNSHPGLPASLDDAITTLTALKSRIGLKDKDALLADLGQVAESLSHLNPRLAAAVQAAQQYIAGVAQ